MNKYYISNQTFYTIPEKPDELCHYGVVGMKWGKRKAAKYERKAEKARSSAKELSERGSAKAAKMLAKSDMYAEKAAKKTRSAEFQQKQVDAKNSRSIGAKLATNLLGGFFANRTYNSVIASGGSKWKARGITAATSLIGGPLGHIIVASVYRADAANKKD